MNLNDLAGQLIGPLGGIFALGMLAGGTLSLRFLAPKMYDARLDALKDKVAALDEEIKPYREFKDSKARAALNAQGGSQ